MLLQFWFDKDEFDIPVYEHVMMTYRFISKLMKEGKVRAAYALDSKGLVAGLSKMAFGNKLGIELEETLKAGDLFENCLGDLVLEMSLEDGAALLSGKEAGGVAGELNIRKVAKVLAEPVFRYQDVTVTMEEALDAWCSKLEKVFPTKADRACCG